MGGSPSQTTQANTTTNPWAPTIPALQGILGQIQGQAGNTAVTPTETNAFNTLSSNAAAGDPYASQIGQVASNLLSGGPNLTGQAQSAYDQYSKQVMPWANGSMGDPATNPALAQMLSTIKADTTNSINSQFAAAGRDMSGLNQQAIARGLAQGEAPTLLNAQTQGLNTAQSLYNAGNSTTGILSGLNQQSLANQQAGIGASNDALGAQNYGPNMQLQIQAAQRNLPLSNIANLSSLLLPIAGLGGQSNSQSTTQTQIPALQQIMGGVAGAGGLLGGLGKSGMFSSGGWLGPSTGAAGAAGAGGDLAGAAGVGDLAAGLGVTSSEAASILPFLMWSDRRLKWNIRPFAVLPNGLTLHSFSYLGSNQPSIGLMADEVEKLYPKAVHVVGIFKAIDYAMAVQ